MELNEVMRTTFAAREYTGEDLPDEVLYEILEVARFAPSGGNRQGNQGDRGAQSRKPAIEISTARRQRRPNVMRRKVNGRGKSRGIPSCTTTRCQRGRYRQHAGAEVADRILIVNASVVLVFVVDLKVVASMDQYLERVGMISGGSIYPFVWNVLLAAREAGYGGTITTLPAAEEPKAAGIVERALRFCLSRRRYHSASRSSN